MKSLIFTFSLLLLGFTKVNAQLNEENRAVENSLENPGSLTNVDNYLLAKQKNALVYGVNYSFSGIAPENVTQAFIDHIDPYSYMTQRSLKNVVSIPIASENITLIFRPINEGIHENLIIEAE